MSNETWHNCSAANIIFGLIPFAYLAGRQSPKVHIKVTDEMQQETPLVLIWWPILITTHRIVKKCLETWSQIVLSQHKFWISSSFNKF